MLPGFLSDIPVTNGPVSDALEGATSEGVLWQAAPGRFLLDLPDVARYLVEGGERITVQSVAGAALLDVTRFGRMLPLAALLYQRGVLAFHAAVVANESGAVLLAGDSGSGKSTQLMELLQRGWKLLADEVAVVELAAGNQLMVHPTFPDVVLWPETVERFGWQPETLHHADVNRLILSQHCALTPFPLRSIFRLGISGGTDVTCSRLTGADLFQTIGVLLFNSHVAAAQLDRVIYMSYASALLKTVPFVRLFRPLGHWNVDEVADQIEKVLQ
jgi:hypothetical protein